MRTLLLRRIMKSTRTLTENLMADDKFKFGGGMFKITDVIITDSMVNITAYDYANPRAVISLTTGRRLPIKIYNQ